MLMTLRAIPKGAVGTADTETARGIPGIHFLYEKPQYEWTKPWSLAVLVAKKQE